MPYFYDNRSPPRFSVPHHQQQSSNDEKMDTTDNYASIVYKIQEFIGNHCVICQLNLSNFIFTPCLHLCICESCLNEFKKKTLCIVLYVEINIKM